MGKESKKGNKMDLDGPPPPSSPPQAKAPTRQLASHYSNTSLFSSNAKPKLQGLTLALQDQTKFEVGEEDTSEDVPVVQPVVSDVMSCNCCDVQFVERGEQLAHYRCDWHRYNLHLRLKGLDCVSEEEFELVSGDVSSISGSDDDDSENEDLESDPKSLPPVAEVPVDETKREASFKGKRYEKLYFKNDQGELISLYKCLLSHKKNPVKSTSDLLATATQLVSQPKWAVLMVSSGHFAGAIFNGKDVVEHKTFHRYTVRAKRGSAQSSRDGQGHAPKSGGASLRRYNEAALSQEVQELMKVWQSSLDSCHLIFVRIPVGNRGMFYAGKTPVLKKDDLRIRIIPFPTRRPTLNEVKRVQQMLSSIECFGQESELQDFVPLSPPRIYCRDTDQLEVRPPNPKPKKNKENLFENDSKEEPVEESEEDDFELDSPGPGNPLKEFEVFVEKKQKKRKKKPGKSNTSNASEENHKNGENEALTELRNSLFTASKTGNIQDLRKTVSDLHHYFQPAKSTPKEATQCGNDSSENGRNKICDDDSQDSTRDQTCGVGAGIDDGIDSTSTTHTNVSEFLSSTFGSTSSTLLHVASQENRYGVITFLLHQGADPSIKNKSEKVPYLLGDSEVKNTYRRFMAAFPDKFDYKQAQIPSPLTPEMEAAKKKKNSERRAAQKKSVQERNKVKKAEELKQKEKNDLKHRFLQLSDREKRALAAERRILQQHNDQGNPTPVLSRCFQCGGDMTGKVPFEYSEFKFCTTKCLRDHRAKPKS